MSKPPIILSTYLAPSSWWFAHVCFGLGRGPITPPGPAMIITDRKDLNSTKKKKLQCSQPPKITTFKTSNVHKLQKYSRPIAATSATVCYVKLCSVMLGQEILLIATILTPVRYHCVQFWGQKLMKVGGF